MRRARSPQGAAVAQVMGCSVDGPVGEEHGRELLGGRTPHLAQELDDDVVDGVAGRSVDRDEPVTV